MKPMFWHLKRKGVLVIFWGIDTQQEFRQALKYPIHGVLTDCPSEMRKAMDSITEKYKTTLPLPKRKGV